MASDWYLSASTRAAIDVLQEELEDFGPGDINNPWAEEYTAALAQVLDYFGRLDARV